MTLHTFRAVWFAAGTLHAAEFQRRNEQAVRKTLILWWGRVCADFEIIEIMKLS